MEDKTIFINNDNEEVEVPILYAYICPATGAILYVEYSSFDNLAAVANQLPAERNIQIYLIPSELIEGLNQDQVQEAIKIGTIKTNDCTLLNGHQAIDPNSLIK